MEATKVKVITSDQALFQPFWHFWSQFIWNLYDVQVISFKMKYVSSSSIYVLEMGD